MISKIEESHDLSESKDENLEMKVEDLKSESKKQSTGSKEENASSFELRSDMLNDADEIQDEGENSTTLSSANEHHSTPESESTKAKVMGPQNIYCFKKEEEFKELLENLEIENIEIDLSIKQNPS